MFVSGYVCIALPGSRLEELNVPMMVPENQDRHRTAYTITVDYKHGTFFPFYDISTIRLKAQFRKRPPPAFQHTTAALRHAH